MVSRLVLSDVCHPSWSVRAALSDETPALERARHEINDVTVARVLFARKRCVPSGSTTEPQEQQWAWQLDVPKRSPMLYVWLHQV
jgi:hypothetical protein